MKKIEKALRSKAGYQFVAGVSEVGRPPKDKDVRIYRVWGPNKKPATMLLNVKSLRYRIVED